MSNGGGGFSFGQGGGGGCFIKGSGKAGGGGFAFPTFGQGSGGQSRGGGGFAFPGCACLPMLVNTLSTNVYKCVYKCAYASLIPDQSSQVSHRKPNIIPWSSRSFWVERFALNYN